jgi:hypothetical protein
VVVEEGESKRKA